MAGLDRVAGQEQQRGSGRKKLARSVSGGGSCGFLPVEESREGNFAGGSKLESKPIRPHKTTTEGT